MNIIINDIGILINDIDNNTNDINSLILLIKSTVFNQLITNITINVNKKSVMYDILNKIDNINIKHDNNNIDFIITNHTQQQQLVSMLYDLNEYNY